MTELSQQNFSQEIVSSPQDQTLQDRLNYQLEHQKKEGEPNIHITLYSAGHETPEDEKLLKDLMQDTDIFAPEFLGWRAKDLENLQACSDGNLSVDSVLVSLGFSPDSANEVVRQRIELIYGSKKYIALFDIPSNNPLTFQVFANDGSYTISSTSFEETLTVIKENERHFSELQNEREAYILEQIPVQISQLKERYPALKEKQDINVLIPFGALHSWFYHQMKQDGYDAHRKFNHMPVIYRAKEEIERRYMFGKPVTDQLAAEALLGIMLTNTYGAEIVHSTNDTLKQMQLERAITRQFSFDEIKQIFESGNFQDSLRRMLAEKNITIPSTENDLDATVRELYQRTAKARHSEAENLGDTNQ